jgi:hypothetical protein
LCLNSNHFSTPLHSLPSDHPSGRPQSPESLRSWKLCRVAGVERYAEIDDAAALGPVGSFPSFVPYEYERRHQGQRDAPAWSYLRALGIQRPNNPARSMNAALAPPVGRGVEFREAGP